jgi:hypothetical protein
VIGIQLVLQICGYRKIELSFTVVAFISILVSLVTAAVGYPLDLLFDILSAPTADSLKASRAENSVIAQTGRRMSAAARRASSSVIDAAKVLLNNASKVVAGIITRSMSIQDQLLCEEMVVALPLCTLYVMSVAQACARCAGVM